MALFLRSLDLGRWGWSENDVKAPGGAGILSIRIPLLVFGMCARDV